MKNRQFLSSNVHFHSLTEGTQSISIYCKTWIPFLTCSDLPLKFCRNHELNCSETWDSKPCKQWLKAPLSRIALSKRFPNLTLNKGWGEEEEVTLVILMSHTYWTIEGYLGQLSSKTIVHLADSRILNSPLSISALVNKTTLLLPLLLGSSRWKQCLRPVLGKQLKYNWKLKNYGLFYRYVGLKAREKNVQMPRPVKTLSAQWLARLLASKKWRI